MKERIGGKVKRESSEDGAAAAASLGHLPHLTSASTTTKHLTGYTHHSFHLHTTLTTPPSHSPLTPPSHSPLTPPPHLRTHSTITPLHTSCPHALPTPDTPCQLTTRRHSRFTPCQHLYHHRLVAGSSSQPPSANILCQHLLPTAAYKKRYTNPSSTTHLANTVDNKQHRFSSFSVGSIPQPTNTMESANNFNPKPTTHTQPTTHNPQPHCQ
ncbi:hypothetical protein Pmani_014098 [Petrolisthes manimaculis]|uniref:Uncharacterized protein n=1 Tax=Petrolisthes manimaculis TaxID=1843537 RepID=A0AAE1PTI7_9EUCA|nr:hypothetical protein Pmani_014098 [Petrolisthes manimaculis]